MRNFKQGNSFIRNFFRCIGIFLVLYLILITASMLIYFFNREKIKEGNLPPVKAFNRAMDIINYKWSYEKKDINENINLPYYIQEKNEYIGIPYCYGGRISIDSSNISDVDNFKDALLKGYYPGNINTNRGYIKNTAGLDCSGFVSAVYNIDENISTESMNKYFKEIDYRDLKPMDIVNSKGKHVYIYLGPTEDNKGIIILESTSNGNKMYKDKAVVNFKTIKEFNKDLNERNYIPMRYVKIKEEYKFDRFDSYEYNNEEKYSKNIELKSEIKATIDYLEDIDYYKIVIPEKAYINVSMLEKNHYINIYNNKDVIKIDKTGEYELFLSGEVYIKVYAKNADINEKDYVFKIFTK